MLTFVLMGIGINLEAQEKIVRVKNNVINKFCIATIKSKLDIENKQNENEISDFTCKCFFKKYNSGSSLKSSRAYCRDKATKKFNL